MVVLARTRRDLLTIYMQLLSLVQHPGSIASPAGNFLSAAVQSLPILYFYEYFHWARRSLSFVGFTAITLSFWAEISTL